MLAPLFRELLYEWHISAHRLLPWLNEKDPYKIWISEIILQQTRVKQGLPYYLKFIEAFPNIHSLANASEDAVLKNWEGLGYYSRARNLHWSAKYILNHLNGQFPDNYNEIIKLKGIGPYTAAAISSFAFSLPHAVLDGNVHRVLSRIFCIKTDISTPKGRKEIQDLADSLLDKENAGKFNQAMMDFGATVCIPSSPLCLQCLFSDHCQAYLTARQPEYPLKKQKLPLRNRYFQLFLIENSSQILLTQRNEKDIWRGLYSFPIIETKDENWELPEADIELGGINISNIGIQTFTDVEKQTLTHQKIHIFFHRIKFETLFPKTFDKGTFLVPMEQIHQYAVPKFLQRFIKKNAYLFNSK